MTHIQTPTPAIDPMHYGIDPQTYARRWTILGVLCLSLVLIVSAVSAVNVALPAISRELRPSSTQLLWIVDAYAVVFAGLLLPFGALGDRFGRKGALQLGLGLFSGASILAAFSNGPAHLIALRCLMGVGAALVMPSTLSLLANIFPPMERAKAIAVWTGFAGAGGALGPVIGGAVLGHFWWGSVFFVSVPIALIALVGVTLLAPKSKESKVVPLDPIGASLSILGFGSLLYGIIEGPDKGWTSPTAITAFVVALVALTSFVLWERRSAHPMLDPKFFKIPRFATGAFAVTFTFMAAFSQFFVLTQYLQYIKGYSALGAAVRGLPFALTLIVISPRAVELSRRFGTKRLVVFGMALVPIGLILLSLVGPKTPYWAIIPILVTSGSGMALAIPSLSSGIVMALPLDKAGVGSAMNDTTREVGGAIGIAVLGTVINSRFRSGMHGSLVTLPKAVADVAKQGLGQTVAVIQHGSFAQPFSTHLLQTARHSFLDGMHLGLRIIAVIGIVAMLYVARAFPPVNAETPQHGPARH